MPLPLITTAVTIARVSEDADPYEDQGWNIISVNVPAVISGSSGTGSDVGGAQQVLSGTLYVDEGTDVRIADLITDETSDQTWTVQWVRARYELGLGHIVAGLQSVTGATN